MPSLLIFSSTSDYPSYLANEHALTIHRPDLTTEASTRTSLTTVGPRNSFQQIVLRLNLPDSHSLNTIPIIGRITSTHIDLSIDGTDDTTGIRLEYFDGKIQALTWISDDEDPKIHILGDSFQTIKSNITPGMPIPRTYLSKFATPLTLHCAPTEGPADPPNGILLSARVNNGETFTVPQLTITTDVNNPLPQIVIHFILTNSDHWGPDSDDPPTLPVSLRISPAQIHIAIQQTFDTAALQLQYENGIVLSRTYIPNRTTPTSHIVSYDPQTLLATFNSA